MRLPSVSEQASNREEGYITQQTLKSVTQDVGNKISDCTQHASPADDKSADRLSFYAASASLRRLQASPAALLHATRDATKML